MSEFATGDSENEHPGRTQRPLSYLRCDAYHWNAQCYCYIDSYTGGKNMSFFRDLSLAFNSLKRTQGLAIAVIATLALGIGANAAIFTLVRGVLLKPLVNRDEDRLIYIRQSAAGIGEKNATFSVPEIHDIKADVHSVSDFGDFSEI